MKFILSILAVLFVQTAFASSLSFHSDSSILQEILNDQKVINKLGNRGRIDSITRRDNTYTVKAGECIVEVNVLFSSNEVSSESSRSENSVPAHTLAIGKSECWDTIWPK